MTEENPVLRKMILLRAAAEDALTSIPKSERNDMGAVNWGDIGVAEVRYWMNDKGETGYTITLEEASPNSRLAAAVFEEMGCPESVEIVCEW